MKETRFKGVYQDKKRFYTMNLGGSAVYGERIVKEGSDEFREWDPKRSKLCAALQKGVSQIGVWPGNVVLYLGASSGTTVSHVSDLVGKDGFVFALDFSFRMVRDLVFLCEKRSNIAPILADAHNPDSFEHRICEADFLYQDIAQRDQAEIFLKNTKFLKKGGFCVLCVKARSVDVSAKPKTVFLDMRKKLEKELTIVDFRVLDPFELDHCLYVCKKT